MTQLHITQDIARMLDALPLISARLGRLSSRVTPAFLEKAKMDRQEFAEWMEARIVALIGVAKIMGAIELASRINDAATFSTFPASETSPPALPAVDYTAIAQKLIDEQADAVRALMDAAKAVDEARREAADDGADAG